MVALFGKPSIGRLHLCEPVAADWDHGFMHAMGVAKRVTIRQGYNRTHGHSSG